MRSQFVQSKGRPGTAISSQQSPPVLPPERNRIHAFRTTLLFNGSNDTSPHRALNIDHQHILHAARHLEPEDCDELEGTRTKTTPFPALPRRQQMLPRTQSFPGHAQLVALNDCSEQKIPDTKSQPSPALPRRRQVAPRRQPSPLRKHAAQLITLQASIETGISSAKRQLSPALEHDEIRLTSPALEEMKQAMLQHPGFRARVTTAPSDQSETLRCAT